MIGSLFVLLMNRIIEGCVIPPIRQKKGEWMGHGACTIHTVGDLTGLGMTLLFPGNPVQFG